MSNSVIIQTDIEEGTINRNIYGHFAEHLGRCIYEGFWVGEQSPIPNTSGIRNDVVEALKKLNIPVLRWPGGCFADRYHWREGVGPREQRQEMLNIHWGGVLESNHFGTHEFMMLCELLGCEAYINGNVGSGTVQEMQEWVEYLTYDGASPMAKWRKANGREEPWKVPYFGVGNENWGCGGKMRPEYYADEYRKFQTYVRNYGDNHIYKIACGANAFDYNWTEVMMREAAEYMNGLSLHYYTGYPRQGAWKKGFAIGFSEAEWFELLADALLMDELITRHSTIMDKYDPERRIGMIVDEWGTWHHVEPGTNPGFLYQQNSMRDAMVTAMTLHIFHDHCNRVQMANLAQTVNVLQAVVLTEGEQMVLTPTYHVFDMYQVHQGAAALQKKVKTQPYQMGERSIPMISATASKKEDGLIHVSLCNLSHKDQADVTVDLRGSEAVEKVEGRILTSVDMDGHNTFEHPLQVAPVPFEAFEIAGCKLKLTMPAMSILTLEVRANG